MICIHFRIRLIWSPKVSTAWIGRGSYEPLEGYDNEPNRPLAWRRKRQGRTTAPSPKLGGSSLNAPAKKKRGLPVQKRVGDDRRERSRTLSFFSGICQKRLQSVNQLPF